MSADAVKRLKDVVSKLGTPTNEGSRERALTNFFHEVLRVCEGQQADIDELKRRIDSSGTWRNVLKKVRGG